LGVLTGHREGDPATEAPPASRAWDTLVRSLGRYVYVNGRTQIRAGVCRPEIVVLSPDATISPAPAGAGEAPPAGDAGRPPAEPHQPPEEARAARTGSPQDADASGSSSSAPDSWVYVCCKPLTPDGYLLRFGHSPVPRPERPEALDLPGPFAGLPVLEGEVAEGFAELAREVAAEAAERIARLTDDLPPTGRTAAALLTAVCVPLALRRDEARRDLWGRRSPQQQHCPGFVLTPASPATVARYAPTAGGNGFLVLLGRAYGWESEHLELLARNDVAMVMETLDDRGRVSSLGLSAFQVLKALKLVRSFLDQPVGRLAAAVVEPAQAAEVVSRAWANAEDVAEAMGPHWKRLTTLVDDFCVAPAASAAEGGGTGSGDLLEGFYACLTDAVLLEGQKARCFPQAVEPARVEVALLIGGPPPGLRLV